MPIDYAALRGDRDTTVGVPKDGTHMARLERAVLHDPDGPKPSLITEWSDPDNVMWTSWFRFTPDNYGLPKTKQLLEGLGIPPAAMMDDTLLTEALDAVVGRTFQVRTESRQGTRGDKWFTDTTIEQSLLIDIPADTEGLPEPRSGTGNIRDEDDDPIPF